ncbi:MAG: S-formylglutathione hydrolase, partial [Proteobacteria bacterium]
MNLLKSHKTYGGQTQFWEHDSKSTQTKMKFSTYVPSMPPKGCLIWLSGLTCTDENFITKAGAQKFLEAHQLMVVCPDTSPRGTNLPHEHESDDFGSGASFYVDATTPGYRDHYRMETYITDELYNLVVERYSLKGRISLMGHSMGGHGALTLGLRHPDLFQSLSAFSPIVHPTAVPWGEKALKGYLGESKDEWKNHDAVELILAGKKHPQPILVDQGSSDSFLEKQLLTPHLQKACETKGQPAEIHMREGYDHSYYFISSFIETHVAFHA